MLPLPLTTALHRLPFKYYLCLSEKDYVKIASAAQKENLVLSVKPSWGETIGRTNFLHDVVIVSLQNISHVPFYAICGILAHEAYHVWCYYLERIGEEKPSEEFAAYGIQAITQFLVEDYMRQTKTKAIVSPPKAKTKMA